jgi:hypothetical protein
MCFIILLKKRKVSFFPIKYVYKKKEKRKKQGEIGGDR